MDYLDNIPTEELKVFESHHEDGHVNYLVYSLELDAVTVITYEEYLHLIERGVEKIDELPD